MEYVIITPAKDEELYIEYTLKSICAQKLKPIEWIIVNDGSTDATAEIVKRYVQKNPWITLINNDSESEQRSGGSKVVRAFNIGYSSLKNHGYNFIVKLDADLNLPEDYFEKIAIEYMLNPRLGMCGGICIVERNRMVVEEGWSYAHIRGALKSYRKHCFEEIGGLKEILDWDGIDEIEATLKGWEIKVIPTLRVLHYRPTRTLINKSFKDFYLMGKSDYRFGYDILISLLRSIKRSIMLKPYFVSGLISLYGYYYALFKRTPKIVTEELGRHANKYKYKYYINIILRIVCHCMPMRLQKSLSCRIHK